jgi:hypothetical protein
MKSLAELIQALAALLWPILTFVLVWRFRGEIADLLKRLKKGKFLGQELELGESLDKLDKSSLAAAAEVPKLPVVNENESQRPKKVDLLSTQLNEPDDIEKILDLAESSPKIALMSLAIEIEKELREIVFSQGQVNRPYTFTIPNAIRILEQREFPTHLTAALQNFQRVRNRIIHGKGEASSDDILRAIDSGIIILKTLQSVPRQINIVHHPGVEIYADKECTQLIPDARGVVLETHMTGHDQKFCRIYPTTRTHFKKGKKIAWEWNSEKSWNEAWYHDPDTGEVKHAWSASLEFVGRNIEDT